jgi:hypothetical protein
MFFDILSTLVITKVMGTKIFLSIHLNVYLDGDVMTPKSEQTYDQKKPHIYAYRRRRVAKNIVEKLAKIIEESNNKDALKLERSVNELWWKIQEKLGAYDDIPIRGERKETYTDKKIKSSLTVDTQPIGQYVCPVCKKPGFLFSPNMDLNENELRLHMLHIDWPTKQTRFCELNSIRRKLILIKAEPVERILTMTNDGIILMP